MKLRDFKKGMIFKMDGEYWQIVNMDLRTPGNLGSLYQVDMKNVKKGNVLRKRMNPTDELEDVFTETKDMEFLYREGQNFIFMDTESYEQTPIRPDQIGEAAQYLRHNDSVQIVFLDHDPVAIDLPASVVLEVTHTEPAARGNTATNVTKPATLETGLVIKVPPHINIGDKVKVDTRSGEFLGRST